MLDKRKVLIRLNQKVRGQEPVVKRHRSQRMHPRRRGQTYPVQIPRRHVVNPECSHPGKQAARQAERAAGRRGWRKRRPSCHEADRSPYSTRKRADFHLVSRHENNGGIGTEGVAHVGGFVPLVLPSPSGNRLTSSIVQPVCFSNADGSFTRPLRCLSRMKGNFHVRF